MPLRIERIDHIVLTVRDIVATCDFYTRVLGFEVVRFDDGRIALAFGSQKFNLHEKDREFLPRAAAAVPGSADFCLITTTPIEDVVGHLEGLGVEIEAGPVPKTGATGPLISVYFRDPDGNLVEVSNYTV